MSKWQGGEAGEECCESQNTNTDCETDFCAVTFGWSTGLLRCFCWIQMEKQQQKNSSMRIHQADCRTVSCIQILYLSKITGTTTGLSLSAHLIHILNCGTFIDTYDVYFIYKKHNFSHKEISWENHIYSAVVKQPELLCNHIVR